MVNFHNYLNGIEMPEDIPEAEPAEAPTSTQQNVSHNMDFIYEETWTEVPSTSVGPVQVTIRRSSLSARSATNVPQTSVQQSNKIFDVLCISHVLMSFTKLGVETELSTEISVVDLLKTCGIQQQFEKFVTYILTRLQQEGYVSTVGNHKWKLNNPFPSFSDLQQQIETCTDSLLRTTQGLETEKLLRLCNRCGFDLDVILTGDKLPLPYFLNENETSVASLYSKIPEVGQRNFILTQLVEGIQLNSEGNHIRVIEIEAVPNTGWGCSNGSVTETVLETLDKINTVPYEYTITNIINKVCSKMGWQSQQPRNRIKYQRLNLGIDLVSQNFIPNSYDILIFIASSVAGQHDDMKNRIAVAKELLKQNGYLILIFEQPHLNYLVLNMTFGLLENWWGNNDLTATNTISQWESTIISLEFELEEKLHDSILLYRNKSQNLYSDVESIVLATNSQPFAKSFTDLIISHQLSQNNLFTFDISKNNKGLEQELSKFMVACKSKSLRVVYAAFNLDVDFTSFQLIVNGLSGKESISVKKFILVTNGTKNSLEHHIQIHPLQCLAFAAVGQTKFSDIWTSIILDSKDSITTHAEQVFDQILKPTVQDEQHRLALSSKSMFSPRLIVKDEAKTSSNLRSYFLQSHLTYVVYCKSPAEPICSTLSKLLWDNGARYICLIHERQKRSTDDFGWHASKKWVQMKSYTCNTNDEASLKSILTSIVNVDKFPPISGFLMAGTFSSLNSVQDIQNWAMSLWNFHNATTRLPSAQFIIFIDTISSSQLLNYGPTVYAQTLAKFRVREGGMAKCIHIEDSIKQLHLITNAIFTQQNGNCIYIMQNNYKNILKTNLWRHSFFNMKSFEKKLKYVSAVINEVIQNVEGKGEITDSANVGAVSSSSSSDLLLTLELCTALEAQTELELNLWNNDLAQLTCQSELAAYIVNELDGLRLHDATCGSPLSQFTNRKQSSWVTFNEDIGVIGVSCRLGTTKNPSEFWEALLRGEAFFREIPLSRFNYKEYYDPALTGQMYTKYGSFIEGVDQFDCSFFEMSPAEAEIVDPQHRLLLQLTWEALENGGIPPDSLKGTKTGVYIGICSHDHEETLILPESKSGAYFSTANINSAASGRISHFLKLHGPSMSIDTACSSSLVALHLALQSLRHNECKMAIVGGVQTLLSPRTYTNYCRAKMLSPNLQCRPFDADADGFVRGEGCTVLVLKKLGDALADGDTVLGVIKGSAINQDGTGTGGGIAVPNGQAQELLINRALKSCSLTPNDIDYIETHGTGTSLGDPIELNALENIFNKHDRPNPLIIGSVKANIGHLEGAAGITSVLKAILALRARTVPPQINFTTINPNVNNPNFFHIPRKVEPFTNSKPLMVGISSFGVSGTNAHVIVEETPSYLRNYQVSTTRYPAGSTSIYLITLSAKTKDALHELIEKYNHHIEKQIGEEKLRFGQRRFSFFNQKPSYDYLRNMAYTTNIGRTHFSKHRAAFVTRDMNDLLDKMTTNSGFYNKAEAKRSEPEVCFLFTGQGSHYLGMAKELYYTNDAFAKYIDDCNEIVQEFCNKTLIEILFDDNSLLEDTRFAQPALFSIEYALASFWIELGVKPSYLIGHSIGEYCVATISGILTLKDALEVVIKRADLIYKLVISQSKDYGMLAINESSEFIKLAVKNLKLDNLVEFSCFNHPGQTVISGPNHALQRFKSESKSHCTLLKVPCAFHSTQLNPIVENFNKILQKVNFNVNGNEIADAKIISTCTGKEISLKEFGTASYWIKHSVEPVNFVAAMNTVQNLAKKQLVFIEVGPQPVLCNLGQNCIKSKANWYPTIRTGQTNFLTLLTTIGQLYVQGFNFNFNLLYSNHKRQKVELPLYPFQNKSYWSKHCTTDWNTEAWTPLAGQLKCRTQDEYIFENPALEPFDRLNYLLDYKFEGELMFPNIGFIEIACQAAKMAFPSAEAIQITEMYMRHPLVLSKMRAVNLQTILAYNSSMKNEDEQTFDIFTKIDESNIYNLHSNGIYNVGNLTDFEAEKQVIDLQALKINYDSMKLATFYESFEKHEHVKYFTRFKCTKNLWVGKEAALSEVHLPENINSGYICHPILLENAFQALCSIFLLNEEYAIRNPLVLIVVDKIQFNFNSCANKAHYFVHAVFKENTGDELRGDIYVTDADGKVLILMEGATC